MAKNERCPNYPGMLACICLCLMHAVTARAVPLTLFNAVNKALATYPLIQQREAEVNAAEAHVTTVEGNRFPTLKLHDQLSFGTANGVNGSFFPMGVVVPTAGGVRANNNYTIASGNIGLSYLEWEVINFGYYKADKRSAEAGFELKKAVLKNDQYSLCQKVASLYITLLKEYQNVRLEQENVQRTQTIFRLIGTSVGTGLRPGADSTIARAEYSQARIGYFRALDNYSNARIELSMYTGLDTSEIVPDTTLYQQMQGLLLNSYITGDTIAEDHPLLDVYNKQYKLALADIRAVDRKFMPKIYLVGVASMRGSSISPTDYYASDLASGLSYSRYNYVLGTAITYNIFDLRHRRDLLSEGRFNAEARKDALYERKRSLLMMRDQIRTSYNNTVLQLAEIPAQVNASNIAYLQQKALYQSGLNTLAEVTNSLYALKEAQSNLVQAQDTFIRLVMLNAAINNQLESFLEKFK